jgi:hypothetical protein
VFTITPNLVSNTTCCKLNGSFTIGLDCVTYPKTIFWTVYASDGVTELAAGSTLVTALLTVVPFTVNDPAATVSVSIKLCWQKATYNLFDCSVVLVDPIETICTELHVCEVTTTTTGNTAVLTDWLRICYDSSCQIVPTVTPLFCIPNPITDCDKLICDLNPISLETYNLLFGDGLVLTNDDQLVVVFSISDSTCLKKVINKAKLIVTSDICDENSVVGQASSSVILHTSDCACDSANLICYKFNPLQ